MQESQAHVLGWASQSAAVLSIKHDLTQEPNCYCPTSSEMVSADPSVAACTLLLLKRGDGVNVNEA